MSERKLASIQRINNVRPIEGADKIEVVGVLGWECVAKKNEFKVGDLVVYIEVDSIVPERQEFEFLRERKFRVKTIRLRKQISQGLVVPLTILPYNDKGVYLEGNDVTEVLGVKKHDPQIQAEQAERTPQSPLLKACMRFAPFRYVYLKLNQEVKGNWPSWIAKTDEERIQSCAAILMRNLNREWYITEKLDGQSATFFTHNVSNWGFKLKEFGVCSRNIWLKTPNEGNYWKIAKKYNIESILKEYNREMVIQGEIIGPGIQGNKYKLGELNFHVFNVLENGRQYTLAEMVEFCRIHELKIVPILFASWHADTNWYQSNTYALPLSACNVSTVSLTGTMGDITTWTATCCSTPVSTVITPTVETKDTVQEMVKLSIGKSTLNDTQREGIVIRLCDNPKISAKIINPEFLLKYDE